MLARFAIATASFFAACACAGASPVSSAAIGNLQQLGSDVRTAVDHAESGHAPPAADIAALRRRLDAMRATAAGDAAFQQKLGAIRLLFAELQASAGHAGSTVASVPRRAFDREIVTARHGGSCAAALGLSTTLPVSLTLAEPGRGRSEAWLRFEAPTAGRYRMSTRSAGADPKIEIFDGCTKTSPLAANDDTLGLDAAATVAVAAHGAVLAHVVNTGPAGSVQIGVNVTPATISGSVKDAATGLPITDAQILACGGFGYCGNSASVDQTGSYSLSTNAGTYYVFAVANGYVAEVYPNAACLPGSYAYDISHCPAERAQTVVLTDGSTLTNTDFSLSVGHSIRGDVRGAANQPLNWAWVWIYDDAGNALTAGFTDSAGHYAFSVLPDASYKLVAKADGYTAQMYYQVNCGNSCNLSLASPATVAGADIGGANFALTQQAAVFGTVTGTGGKPLQNSNVSVVDGNGTVYANGWTDQYGHYSAGPLSPGNYYVYASSQGYFSQILNGIDCGPDCLKSGGTPTGVTIATPAQQVEADFALDPLPLVTGHISDRVSGHPLANVTIAVSNTPPANFVEIANTVSDVNGNYTLASVPAGTYYVWALSPDHIDEVYPNLPCENSDTYFFSSTPCSVVGATLLTITPGQAPGAFDFSLNPSSSIGGTALISAGAGSDLSAGVAVAVYDDTGTSVGSATPDTSGHYVVNDLPPGTYFAAAVNDSTYVEQIWQQIDCPEDCAPTTGTPIVLSQGSEAEADFTVTRRNAVVGRVTDPTGAPIPGALVDLFDTANGMYFASGVADAQGYYVAAGNLGHDYFLGTEAGPGYYDQVYAGIACPLGAAYYGLCPLTNATAVPLSASSMQPHIVNFVLQSNDPIFANGFE